MKLNEPINLKLDEILTCTNGYLVNKQKLKPIYAITNGLIHNEIQNALWITRNPENWGKDIPNTVKNIPNMIKKNPSYIMIEKRFEHICTEYPKTQFIVVNNTRKALRNLADASTAKLSEDVKTVQITGTEGKTSFKYLLSLLASKQINTFFQRSSANMQVPILLSQSNIKQNTKLNVIEISAPAKDLGKNRSILVKPDIAVITNISPSHLNSHGSLKNLISNKAQSVIGLKKNGVCILNGDAKNITTLKDYVQKFRSDIKVYTFGEDPSFDAYISKKEFKDFGWNIQASVNDKKVSYRVNRVQSHIPSSTLGVFLCLDLLGLDLEHALNEIQTHDELFASSGNIYRMKLNDKNDSFIFYDQHFSITELALKSSLEDISRVKVDGKKIAVISGEYNCDQFTKEVHERIGEYINNSDIDILYTVGEHIDISTNKLTNKSIHKQHFENIEDCTRTVLENISKDDFLLIKGMTKLNFKFLSDKIKEKYTKTSLIKKR